MSQGPGSPIQQLPNGILSRIMTLAIHPINSNDHTTPRRTLHALAGVSSSWRAVAHGLPEVREVLHLSAGRSQCVLAASNLTPAEGLQLDFHIHYPDDGNFDQVINQLRHRIKTLTISGSTNQFLTIVAGWFLVLTTMKIESEQDDPFRLDFSAPILGTFHFTGALPGVDQSTHMPVVNDVVLKNLGATQEADRLAFSDKCASLRSLEIYNFDIQVPLNFNSAPIPLSFRWLNSCRGVVISGTCTTDVRGFLNMARAPGVQSLRIENLIPDAQGATGYPHGDWNGHPMPQYDALSHLQFRSVPCPETHQLLMDLMKNSQIQHLPIFDQ